MIRSALLLLSGNAFASALLLARNLFIARMLTVADYGIASTFALALAVIEMTSAFGLQQQIIQSKDGDDPYFQTVLQGFQLLRGVIAGGAIFLLAGPLARFLGIPEVTWAYQVLAVVPVLNALVHFDIHRMNRRMQFGPMLWTSSVPALVALVVVWPLAWWFGNWQVMLWSIILQTAVTAIVSHVLAERPWRLALDRKIIAGSMRFGWPLLANGVLMFLVFQGDRIIVGRELGMESLAIFSMGITLTLTPTLIVAKSATNLFLPKLAAVQRTDLQRISEQAYEFHMFFAAILVVACLLLGPVFVHVALGAKYAALIPMLVWLAILQGLRIFKGGPSTVALALAQTENAVIANIPRIVLLAPEWWIAYRTGEVAPVIALAILGEMLGVVVAFWLARQRNGLDLRPLMLPTFLTCATMAAAGLNAWGATPFAPAWTVGLTIAFCLAAAASMRPLWQLRR